MYKHAHPPRQRELGENGDRAEQKRPVINAKAEHRIANDAHFLALSHLRRQRRHRRLLAGVAVAHRRQVILFLVVGKGVGHHRASLALPRTRRLTK